MTDHTEEKIIEFAEERDEFETSEISEYLDLETHATIEHLNTLRNLGYLEKIRQGLWKRSKNDD